MLCIREHKAPPGQRAGVQIIESTNTCYGHFKSSVIDRQSAPVHIFRLLKITGQKMRFIILGRERVVNKENLFEVTTAAETVMSSSSS